MLQTAANDYLLLVVSKGVRESADLQNVYDIASLTASAHASLSDSPPMASLGTLCDSSPLRSHEEHHNAYSTFTRFLISALL